MATRLLPLGIMGRPRVSLVFDPRDIWVGVYWTVERFGFSCGTVPSERWPGREDALYERNLRVYVCAVPMLPIVLFFQLKPHRMLNGPQ